MDLDWPRDDSSRSIERDESQAGPSTSMQSSTGVARSPTSVKPTNGLFAIDDFDFEALIEILGTNGEGDKGNGKGRSGASDDLRLMQNSEQQVRYTSPVARRPDDVMPSVMREAPEGAARPPAKTSSEPIIPPSSEVGAPKGPAVPSNPPSRNTLQPAVEQVPSSTRIPRASSPGSSHPTGDRKSHERARATAKLDFTQLNEQLGTSVSEVKGQVTDLRSRIQILKDGVKEFAPHLYRRAFDAPDAQTQRPSHENMRPFEPRKHTDAKGKGKAVPLSHSADREPPTSELEVISALSEDEAKSALVNICRTLHISPSNLVISSAQIRDQDLTVPPSNLSDINRALRLVSELDQLVWKKSNRRDLQSGFTNDQTSYGIYDEENIQAISDRVRLWERTARSRVGRRPGL